MRVMEPIASGDITLTASLPLSKGFPLPNGAPQEGSTQASDPIPAEVSAGEASAVDLPDALRQLLARHQLLVPLLRQCVIAKAVGGVTLGEAEQQEAQKTWLQKQGIQSQEQLQSHLALHGMTEADALWQAVLPLRIHHHCHDQFLHRAEQRFLSRKQQLDTVIYSLLRVSSEALANELYLRIAEGEADFAELAASYAEGMEQATRGVVGPVPLTQAHPILANVLRTSQPGELRPPLQIEPWWLVVRLESLQPASFDEAMQGRMTHELFEEWVQEEVKQQITGPSSGPSTGAP
ncbi:MAG: peptidylprolyl isomerase [Cyanobacteriota bacterium]|nr:peptidylprolyl isomerase [Cyanobacteriota bacterium]